MSNPMNPERGAGIEPEEGMENPEDPRLTEEFANPDGADVEADQAERDRDAARRELEEDDPGIEGTDPDLAM